MRTKEKSLFYKAFCKESSVSSYVNQENFRSVFAEWVKHHQADELDKETTKEYCDDKLQADTLDANIFSSVLGELEARHIEKHYQTSFFVLVHRLLRKTLFFLLIDKKKVKSDVDLILNSEYFSPSWYSEKYEIEGTKEYLAKHYLFKGFAQLNDPSEMFSTLGYFSKNPDIAIAAINPLVHYLRLGRLEKRKF